MGPTQDAKVDSPKRLLPVRPNGPVLGKPTDWGIGLQYTVANPTFNAVEVQLQFAGPEGAASRHFPLSDLALNFEAVFVDHIGSFLDPVDIARLAMTCTWGHGWGESPKTPIRLRCSDGYRNPMHMRSSSSLTERLYEQVCKKLGLSKFFNPLWCGSNTPSLH